jgi:hypothetical protein
MATRLKVFPNPRGPGDRSVTVAAGLTVAAGADRSISQVASIVVGLTIRVPPQNAFIAVKAFRNFDRQFR